MCCCLLLLTGANFFVYKNSDSKAKVENHKSKGQGKETPCGEESSKTGSNLSIQEEYVHEFHLQHQVIFQDKRTQYNLFGEEENAMVHYELISPPPDFL